MKTLRMTLMISFTFAAMMTLAATEKTETFKLKYLSEVTKGKVVHTLPIQAANLNEAIVKSNKQCVSDLMDLNIQRDDILDMCNNPRL